ncbi:hypothetical protein [Rhodococcus sp. 2G]|uniref:hypothetical protein n=1 Tax=Rhodococcus sp. 2G TaxID=1570939 RepID=UPI000B1CEF92|nr:hypothetical protein [Rhodococcus sp. 2G]
MNILHIPHHCELPSISSYPYNTVMECEDCSQIWVRKYGEWVRLSWYHFEARRHLVKKRTDER